MAKEHITFGPWAVRVASRDLDKCVDFDCLEDFNVNFSTNQKEIVCSVLEGPTDIRRYAQNVSIGMSSKRLNADNVSMAIGSGASIKTGTDVSDAKQVGDPSGSASDGDDTEWWLVPVSGSSPNLTYTAYLHNANVENLTTYYADQSNIPTSNVSAASASDEASIDDACNGKVSGDSLDSSTLNEGSSYSGDPDDYKIHGHTPTEDPDLSQGDTFALVGFAYDYDVYEDSNNTDISDTQIKLIEVPEAIVGEPVKITAIHKFQADPKKAVVFKIWKAISTPDYSFSASPDSDNEITVDFNFRSLSDKSNHPNSPHWKVEFIDSNTDLPEDEFDLLP